MGATLAFTGRLLLASLFLLSGAMKVRLVLLLCARTSAGAAAGGADGCAAAGAAARLRSTTS